MIFNKKLIQTLNDLQSQVTDHDKRIKKTESRGEHHKTLLQHRRKDIDFLHDKHNKLQVKVNIGFNDFTEIIKDNDKVNDVIVETICNERKINRRHRHRAAGIIGGVTAVILAGIIAVAATARKGA